MSKKERKRVTKEQVRENAKHGDRGPPYLKLPNGVEEWHPEKPGKYMIDVLPYLVKESKHPDNGIEEDTVWYKRTMRIHHGIGPESSSYVCPLSLGNKCPIHEDRAKIIKKGGDGKEYEKLVKDLDGQPFLLFNMKDPEDRHKVRVFCMSSGKIWSFKGGGLKKELEEGDEANLLFWDVRKKRGRTMEVRFSEETYMGAKYLQATRFSFEERKDMDEDEVLERTVELSEVINVLPYDKLKELYLQTSSEDDEKSSKKKHSHSKKDSSSGSSSSASSSGSKSSSSGSDSSESSSGSASSSDSSDSEEKTKKPAGKKPAKKGAKSSEASGSESSSGSSESSSVSDSSGD